MVHQKLHFNDYINASAVFKINGVAKWSGDTNVGNNSFGTHAITWNGGDALTFTTELYQQDLKIALYKTYNGCRI